MLINTSNYCFNNNFTSFLAVSFVIILHHNNNNNNNERIYIAPFQLVELLKALYNHYYPDRPKGALEYILSFLGSIQAWLPVRRQCLAFWQYLSLSIVGYPFDLGGVSTMCGIHACTQVLHVGLEPYPFHRDTFYSS